MFYIWGWVMFLSEVVGLAFSMDSQPTVSCLLASILWDWPLVSTRKQDLE